MIKYTVDKRSAENGLLIYTVKWFDTVDLAYRYMDELNAAEITYPRARGYFYEVGTFRV